MTTQTFDRILFPSPSRRPRQPQRRRYPLLRIAAPLVGIAIGLVGLISAVGASAYWSGTSTTGGSTAAVGATVPAGPQPTLSISGSAVIVRWTAVSMPDGTNIPTFLINRYNSSGVQQTITTDCAGTVSNLGCIEQTVPAGTWRYTVTALFGTTWKGAESALASAATITSTSAPTTNNVWMWVTP